MSRPVKCPYCEKTLPKSEAYPYKKRYYHRECFEEWKQESDDRKDLIEYICKLYDLEAPTGMILRQIKNFREGEEYGYTYKGMELTLKYFYETLGNKIKEGEGIGIVPYAYEDAKKQFIKMQSISESAANEKNHQIKERVVYIQKGKRVPKNLIDINSI